MTKVNLDASVLTLFLSCEHQYEITCKFLSCYERLS